jgi:hypothetical protein
MASVIIGSAIDATITSKALQRQNFNKEPNGLETIVEVYAIKTENRDAVVPEKNTPHSVFSSSAKTYTRMVVESVVTEEQDGGITQMLVTYVGLTTLTGLPPAIVRIIPASGEGVYGPPIVIEAEYVTDSSETQFMAGQLSQNNGALPLPSWKAVIAMPASINGTSLPKNPVQPFFRAPQIGGGIIENYSGYCVLSKSCERRGLFLVARDTFHEVQEIAVIRSGTLQ